MRVELSKNEAMELVRNNKTMRITTNRKQHGDEFYNKLITYKELFYNPYMDIAICTGKKFYFNGNILTVPFKHQDTYYIKVELKKDYKVKNGKFTSTIVAKEVEVMTVISYKYIPKINKYLVKLLLEDSVKKEIWMSERQFRNLEIGYNQLPKGYSTKYIRLVSCWNEKVYYKYSKIVKENNETLFKEPIQYNLSDLLEVD